MDKKFCATEANYHAPDISVDAENPIQMVICERHKKEAGKYTE